MPDAQRPTRVIRFGVFELDPHSGDLRKDGNTRPRLQGQPLGILLQLLETPGEIVTREELRVRLWPADTFVDFDHSLNAAVNKLREALEDSANNPRFIQTLPRRGYRFIAPVNQSSPAIAPTESDATQPAVDAPRAKLLSDAKDLPGVARGTARLLFSLIQLLYLGIYISALANVRLIDASLSEKTSYAEWLIVLLIVTATTGIAVRLYFLTAAIFGFQGLTRQFLRLFPLIFPLDELWALSPFFLMDWIGIGPVMGIIAALLFLPFSERSVLLMGERGAKPETNP